MDDDTSPYQEYVDILMYSDDPVYGWYAGHDTQLSDTDVLDIYLSDPPATYGIRSK
jgi:hypothetical protein